jgi:hypothetical protein
MTSIRTLHYTAPGRTAISAPFFKALARDNDIFIDHIYGFVAEVFKTKIIPTSWAFMDCKFLFKSKDAALLKNYRTIWLMELGEKIVLGILARRTQKVIETLDIETQCGFRNHRGCIDAVFNTRMMLKKRQEHGLDTFANFIGIVKAFDSVDRDMLWVILLRFGFSRSYIGLVRALHDHSILMAQHGNSEGQVKPLNGLRQGCKLAAPLFVLYCAATHSTWERKKRTASCLFKHDRTILTLHGIPIETEGEDFKMDDTQYADDMGIFNVSREDADMDSVDLDEHYDCFRLKWHRGTGSSSSKTECVYFQKQLSRYDDPDTLDGADLTDIRIKDGHLPFTDMFVYLGSLLDSSLSDEKDVIRRCQNGKKAFFMLKSTIFKNRSE